MLFYFIFFFIIIITNAEILFLFGNKTCRVCNAKCMYIWNSTFNSFHNKELDLNMPLTNDQWNEK